jgi:hypothetical protein
MINCKHIFASIICSFICTSINAQFINLQIRIEPELSATVEQDLNFGQLVINSGPSIIELGDLNMGIFNIRSYYTQNVYIQLDVPEALTHNNPAVNDVIPIELGVAYNNSGERNVDNSIVLNDNSGFLPIYEAATTGFTSTTDIWQEMYLYVFGSIIVGNINEGEYNGEVTLLIEYD